MRNPLDRHLWDDVVLATNRAAVPRSAASGTRRHRSKALYPRTTAALLDERGIDDVIV